MSASYAQYRTLLDELNHTKKPPYASLVIGGALIRNSLQLLLDSGVEPEEVNALADGFHQFVHFVGSHLDIDWTLEDFPEFIEDVIKLIELENQEARRHS